MSLSDRVLETGQNNLLKDSWIKTLMIFNVIVHEGKFSLFLNMKNGN